MGFCSLPFVQQIKKVASLRGLFLAVMLMASNSLHAAVVENILTFNPKAFALGNAVTADYVGVDSLHYNPAALINLKPGFSSEWRLIGAPLLQVVRRVSPQLTPKYPEFTLFYRGYTVRCDSAYKPFATLGFTPGSMASNPGRDPVSGGLDPSVPSLNYDIPGDVCFGPELINPNGIFTNDPLDSPESNLDTQIPIPGAVPILIPNIGYKSSADSRVAFAAQVSSQAPVPTLSFQGNLALMDDLGIQRLTFSPGMAFQVTDKLSVGAALRVSKSRLQTSLYLDGQSQLLGFLNAVVHDLCKTNESRRDSGSQFIYDQMFNCVQLYQIHQERVDAGKARDAGYWPFLPWDKVGEVIVEGQTPVVYGWNFGVQWKPMPWMTWGAAYRTKENDIYDTNGRVYYEPGITAIINGLNSVPVVGLFTNLLLDGSSSDRIAIDLLLPWPTAFSTGVSLQLLDKTKVNIEYRRYGYSVWKTWDATITSTEVNAIGFLGLLSPNNVGSTIPIPAGGVDTSYWAFGVEQQWNKRLAFRFGYEDRPFLKEGAIFPVNTLRLTSVGAEYKLTHDKTVDMSLSSMHVGMTQPEPAQQSLYDNPLAILSLRGAEYRAEQSFNMLIFSASYTHRF